MKEVMSHTLQQLMETMRAFQEANEQYKQEQERIREEANFEQTLLQHRLMVEIEVSRAANEELRKSNEDLRRNLHQRDRSSTRERGLNSSLRDSTKPFSQAIMDEPVLAHYMTPKIASFTWVKDLENHLTTFNAQMITSRRMNAIRCKMFMSTFTDTTQWFNGLL